MNENELVLAFNKFLDNEDLNFLPKTCKEVVQIWYLKTMFSKERKFINYNDFVPLVQQNFDTKVSDFNANQLAILKVIADKNKDQNENILSQITPEQQKKIDAVKELVKSEKISLNNLK